VSELRLNMMMSLDGYTAGPEQSVENPFGLGGMQLNEWLFPLRAFREMQGEEGGTTFHFVTDGIESALEQAREAAAGKDVSLGGGSRAVQQYLAAGLVDEILISLVPVFLGGGTRLFDNLGEARPRLEQVQVVEAPGVTHIRYRVG
jgi:dihydrofolate reductase